MCNIKENTQLDNYIQQKVFSNEYSKDFVVEIVELMEKNIAQVEKIRILKLEQESQAIILCEATE